MDLLKKGDTIAIAATARKVSEQEILPAVKRLEVLGLKVLLPDDLFAEKDQYAGTHAQRTAVFQQLLNNPEIKAILCARGGYGSVHIADALDFDLFVEYPKWIIGYSDVTVIHSHLYNKLAYPSIHGPMAFNFQETKWNAESFDSLIQTLFKGPQSLEWNTHPLSRWSESAEGTLIGGNLSVLYSLMGSASEPDYAGKILFLEDLDEYLYHIDRMMTALKRAGRLSKLEALVIGDMSDMKDNVVPFGRTAYEIIADTVKGYEYPVVFGAPIGHEPRNLSIVHGRRYKLIPGTKTTRLEPIVR